jgi:histidine triad (HIT) family protein
MTSATGTKHCPFCEIAAGRTDQETLYADDQLVAFLCEPPATWGHTLIAPRAHKRDIWAIEPAEAAAAMKLACRLAEAMRDELGAVGVNLRQNSGCRAGQDVFHFHMHVVPRYEDDTVLPGCIWGEPPWLSSGRRRPRTAARCRSVPHRVSLTSEVDRRQVELGRALHRGECDREILDREPG